MRRVIAFFLAAVLFAYPILQPVALYALESQLDGVTQLDSADQAAARDDAPSIDSQQDEESPNDGGENGQNGSSPASSAGDPSASGDAGRGTLPDSTDVLQGVNGEEDSASSSQVCLVK